SCQRETEEQCADHPERHEPAAELVTGELPGEQAVPEWIEHPGPRAEHEQAAHDGAHFAAELPAIVHDVPVVADALNVLHAAKPERDRVQQRVEIALAIRRPAAADFPARGEERAAEADEAVDARLDTAQPHLIANIGAFAADLAVVVDETIDAA